MFGNAVACNSETHCVCVTQWEPVWFMTELTIVNMITGYSCTVNRHQWLIWSIVIEANILPRESWKCILLVDQETQIHLRLMSGLRGEAWCTADSNRWNVQWGLKSCEGSCWMMDWPITQVRLGRAVSQTRMREMWWDEWREYTSTYITESRCRPARCINETHNAPQRNLQR
jgi:hypothetical protein